MTKIKVAGYKFCGIACGIKKSRRKDLALIVSDTPANAGAVFTTNQVKAAPVIVGALHIRRGKIQALVINSGNANACTGRRGLRDAEMMCRETAAALAVHPNLVLPSSTGVIGVPLPGARLRSGIWRAAKRISPEGFNDAAEAIMTTDRFTKTAFARVVVGGKAVGIAGMAKGAGMIAPHVATMLAYVLTDAAVERRCLDSILRSTAGETFNCVTVDGDMSTNDTVVLMANGAAGNRTVRRASRDASTLAKAVLGVMRQLALKIVEDGEGATKVVEIRVEQAHTAAIARRVALSVARSQLVKTAFFGSDPNFGRILAAVGYAGVPVNPARINVAFNSVPVARNGVGITSAERKAARVLQRPSFQVKISLGAGTKTATVWTSDLSHEYVRINSAYRT